MQAGPAALRSEFEAESLSGPLLAPPALPSGPQPKKLQFGVAANGVIKMLAIPTDSLTPRPGEATPVSRLDPVLPRPGHTFGKSALKKQAD